MPWAKLTAVTPTQLATSFWLGAKRRWWTGLRMSFAAIGAAWTVTEILTRSLPSLSTYIDTHGAPYLWAMFVLFGVVFLGYVREPLKVSFKVPTTDTRVTLLYGDLFSQNANLLIGVSEFFDGELGEPVAASSLHGQLITRNYGGSAASFRTAIDMALHATGADARITQRLLEPRKAYPIGTTPFVQNGRYRAFLMAMAHADLRTFKVSSDVSALWSALQGAFQSIRNNGGGEPLAMPLFGNGQSGINLKPQHLLRLLTLAIIDFSRNSSGQFSKEITVVLHHRCFEELDIREIAHDWNAG